MSEIQINYEVVMKNEEGLIKWLELLHYYGIAIIKNAPTEKKSALKILDKISHTRKHFLKHLLKLLIFQNQITLLIQPMH